MVFKRRTPRSYMQMTAEMFYPRGGWRRAASYVTHRLRRLPDKPHRIARGIFAGIVVSFTPFFGLHFATAVLLAAVMRGNMLAALLATFVDNPITFPFIALFSVELGHWMLGLERETSALRIAADFGYAGAEIWANIKAVFTDDVAHWSRLSLFFSDVFLPYLVGGLAPGIVLGAVGYYLSLPVIGAYQKRRRKKLKERYEKLRAAKDAKGTAAAPAPAGD
ncbi:MAG: DUF2062 domain-containing protein [Paracoccaceae bacterium]